MRVIKKQITETKFMQMNVIECYRATVYKLDIELAI